MMLSAAVLFYRYEIIENDKKLQLKGKMKPTICLKIFSFSADDIMSTAVKFICSKIILPWTLYKCQIKVDLETKIQYWSDSKRRASELRVCKLQVLELWAYEFASRKSASWELNKLRILSFKSTNLQVASCNSTRMSVASCESISNWVTSHINLHIDSRLQMRESKNN